MTLVLLSVAAAPAVSVSWMVKVVVAAVPAGVKIRASSAAVTVAALPVSR